MGDSFGVSTLTDQDDILSEQMRALGTPTYNMSVDAANPWQEVVTFAHEIDKIPLNKGARVDWLVFEGNDLDGRFFPEWPLEEVQNSSLKALGVYLQNYYKNSVIRNIYKSVVAHRAQATEKPPHGDGPVLKHNVLGQKLMFDKSYVETSAMSASDVLSHPNAKHIERCFSYLKKVCDAKGLELRCVVVPTKARVYEWVLRNGEPWTSSKERSPFAELFFKLGKGLNVSYLDLTPVLIDVSKEAFESKKSFVFWYDDTHWNDVAQAAVAKVLVK